MPSTCRNWQWPRSVGVDPAPYFRRLFNPVLQQRRFDPDGAYVRRWGAELRDMPTDRLAEPWTMSAAEQAAAGCVIGRDYPAPLVEHAHERRRANRALPGGRLRSREPGARGRLRTSTRPPPNQNKGDRSPPFDFIWQFAHECSTVRPARRLPSRAAGCALRMLKGDGIYARTPNASAVALIPALSTYWTLGWVVGAVVILLVAVLLLTITALAKKIDTVALDLVTDLDAIAEHTAPLQALGTTNNSVHTITRCLRKARGEAPAVDRYSTSPGWRE